MRCLEGPALNELPDAASTLAERLGEWLDWRDAVALFDALQAVDAAAPAPGPAVGAGPLAALRDELSALRSQLARDIAQDAALGEGPCPPEARALVRSRHAAWQRRMEAAIGPLRERVRAAVSAAAPALGRLAALDALMDRALAVRERQLLSNVPVLFEHAQARRADGSAAAPSLDGSDWQRCLVAELDLRLQPVEGLLEAWAEALRPVAPHPTPTAARHD